MFKSAHSASTYHWRLAIIGLLVLSAVPASAQSRGRTNGTVKVGANGLTPQQIQQQLQAIANQLKQGDKPLKEANDKLIEERKAHQKAELEHKQNIRDISQAKRAAEEEAKNAPEVKAAQKKLADVSDQLASVRKKVTESLLKEKEDYRTAVKAHDDAAAELKGLSATESSAELRKTLAKKVSDLDARRKTFEDVAMADHSEAKELTAKYNEAKTEAAAATKKKHDQLENDPKIASAKIGFQRTRDALKKANADLEQAEGAYGRVQSQLQALHNQQANLQAQQQQMQQMQGNKGKVNGVR